MSRNARSSGNPSPDSRKPRVPPPERKRGENLQRNKQDRDRQGPANDIDPDNSPGAG